jgi:hypothetical protein
MMETLINDLTIERMAKCASENLCEISVSVYQDGSVLIDVEPMAHCADQAAPVLQESTTLHVTPYVGEPVSYSCNTGVSL